MGYSYSRKKIARDKRCCACGVLICRESDHCVPCSLALRRCEDGLADTQVRKKRRRAADYQNWKSNLSTERRAYFAAENLQRRRERVQRRWVDLAVLGLHSWQYREPKPPKPPRPVLTEADRALRRRLKNQRKWAKRKGAKGRIKPADIEWLKSAQKGRCFYCCDRLGAAGFQIDHFVPLARGGSNERENLRLACAECNLAKSDKPAAEFMGMLLI